MMLMLNTRQRLNGLHMLNKLPEYYTPLVFFDPQYRGIMDKLSYGNEGARQIQRAVLPQMDEELIRLFMTSIENILKPKGHLMMWVDKYILLTQLSSLYSHTNLQIVDMITWDKTRIGMGYRSRRRSEYLVIFQKEPIRAKGVWKDRGIPDVWSESISNKDKLHVHQKPIGLLTRLIQCVATQGDIVVDPCAGSYNVMTAANSLGIDFMGCDIIYGDDKEDNYETIIT